MGAAIGADDPLTDDKVIVKTEGPHQLLLPADWPVEQKDGRYAPAPIEEYLSLKFGQVREKFAQVDSRADGLERRLAQLEQDQRALFKGLKLLEARLAATEEANHGDEAQGGEAAR